MAKATQEAPPQETQETPSGDEPDEPDTEHVEPNEPESEPQEPPQAPPTTAGDDQKAVRALGRKLDREREQHAKRLGDILGDAATDTLPCPLCFEGLQGFVIPQDLQQLGDEQRAILSQLLGVEPEPELAMAEGVIECDRCNGYGQLKYPGRNPHMAQQTCPKCTGNGYVNAPGAGGSVAQLATYNPQAFGATPPPAVSCPVCGQAGLAGVPHFCNPAAGQAVQGA